MDLPDLGEVDVVVVGAGNAAMCAAFAARDAGASVAVLERAPEAECGGNSAFTSGTGLVSGPVFGRIAGAEAAAYSRMAAP